MSETFKRQDEPHCIAPGIGSATKYALPSGYFKPGGKGENATSYWLSNPNPFYIRVKGSGDGITGTGAYEPAVEPTGGRAVGDLYPPGYFGPMSSAQPLFVSVLAIKRMGITPVAPVDPVEITYGNGG